MTALARVGRYAAWGIGLAAAIAVLGFLYMKTRSVDLEAHADVIELVARTRHQSAVVKEQVLAIRFGLLGQYDPLTQTLSEIDSSNAELAEKTRAFASTPDADLERAIDDLERTAKERRAKAERFKRENAILKNSLYYLPVAAEHLTKALDPTVDETTQENLAPTRTHGGLVFRVNGLVRTTLIYNLQADAALRTRHQRQLAALKRERERVPPELATDFDLLLAHAATIERQQNIVDPLLNDLLDNSLEDRIAALGSAYERRFSAAALQANRFRSMLYVWSVVVFLFAIVVAGKLRSVYRNLERLVAERTRELDEAVRELWGEMQLARKIQTALVPPHPVLKNCEVAAVMKPAEEVGGDYYDVIEIGGREWILIGDVSGHGVPAGLVMMMCQTAVHTALLQNPTVEPDRLIAIVNRALTENIRRLGENKYMTLSAICRDESGRFRVAGLHQDVFIYRAAAKSVEVVSAAGAWLGIVEDIHTKLRVDVFDLAEDDVLLLYTDGVTEARRQGEMLDNPGLQRMLERLGGGSASQVVSSILDELSGYEVDDDLALIAIKQRAVPARAGLALTGT